MLEKLYINTIAGRLDVKDWQVEHCIELFEEGATVPFISRYRKERTGALDEVQVAEIRFHYQKFLELVFLLLSLKKSCHFSKNMVYLIRHLWTCSSVG